MIETRSRQLEFLLPLLTPRTVFMEIGSRDGELSRLAAGYVDRVWCVDARAALHRPPCNLRWSTMGGVPLASVHIAFSEALANPDDVCRLLAPGGVYFVYGALLPGQVFREAGFSRVQYYAGNLRVPGALARISGSTTTAAYR